MKIKKTELTFLSKKRKIKRKIRIKMKMITETKDKK